MRKTNMNSHNQNKKLIDYARRGDLTQVNALLSEGADPDIVDYDNQTPLYYAVLHGKKEIVEALLKKGANPNFPHRGTLIKLAADNDRIEIIKLLIQYKADTNQRNIPILTVSGRSFEHTLLYWAATFKYLDIIKALKGTDVNNERHNGVLGSSPLEQAAERGELHVVDALLAIGANPNQESKTRFFGTSPLIAAIKKGHLKVVETLLEHGVDPTMSINAGTYNATDPVTEAERFAEIARLLRTFCPKTNKARNHLYYILNKGHALDDLPYILQEPYPDLLKALVIHSIEQKRLDILDVILKNYKKEKLAFLTDLDVIQKIYSCLEQDESMHSIKLSLIEKLKLLTPAHLEKLKKIEDKIHVDAKQDAINPVYTDLFNAVNQDEYETVKKILEDNPTLNLNNPIKNSNNASFLDIAYTRMLSNDIAAMHEVKVDSELKKRSNDNKKIFFLLLDRSNINSPSSHGQSLLHIAVTGKAPLHHLVLLLLKEANPHLRDNKDKKPIDYLIDKDGNFKDDEMSEHKNLLEKGINYLLQPEQYALLNNMFEQLKDEDLLLFDYLNNLFIQYKNNKGQTALDIAIQKENFALVNFLLEKGAIVHDNTFNSTSCLKHFNYLYAQCGALEKIPKIIKNPYPMLLRVMIDAALQNGRVDILNAIAENYTAEQLSVLKETEVIQKIHASLEKVRVTALKHYRENWPIIKKLEEVNPSYKKSLETSKNDHPRQSKNSKFSFNRMFLLFSKIRSPFSSRENASSTNRKVRKK